MDTPRKYKVEYISNYNPIYGYWTSNFDEVINFALIIINNDISIEKINICLYDDIHNKYNPIIDFLSEIKNLNDDKTTIKFDIGNNEAKSYVFTKKDGLISLVG